MFDYSVEDFERYLEGYFSSLKEKNLTLFEPMLYAVKSGGKRVRPMLMLFAAKMLKVQIDLILPYALAVECIHSYSLVHDDLPAMDNDLERRGKPTVFAKFGEAEAILTGDALLNLSYEILFENAVYNRDCFIQIAKAAGVLGMVGGQALEIEILKNKCLFKQELESLAEEVYLKKTGALIYASVLVPCLLSDQKDKIETFKKIAKNIGLIFQLVDDIQDAEKDFISGGLNLVNITSEKYVKNYINQLDSQIKNDLKILNLDGSLFFEYVAKLTHRII